MPETAINEAETRAGHIDPRLESSRWRDAGTATVHKRLAEIGLPPDAVSTMFDFIDLDEGRPVKFE